MLRLRWRHNFPEVLTLEDLDRAIASSKAAPMFLYKHSLTCGSSAYALDQLTRLAASDVSAPIHLVPVQNARDVSNAIAERFGLRHESPQLILVEDGAVRWQTSHFGITADRAREALQALAPAPRT
jgi:bacillithiol system protein YtxJ